MRILFIQKRVNKGGAQHALYRLATQLARRDHEIVVLSAESGWLSEQLRQIPGVTSLQLPFPSARSWTGRLYRMRGWRHAVEHLLAEKSFVPQILHANEYLEAPYLIQLRKLWPGIPTLIHLRNAHMSEKDYRKYGCDNADLRLLVSRSLQKQCLPFLDAPNAILHDFIDDSELHTPHPPTSEFPHRILVLGNPHPAKGWDLLLEALARWPESPIRELHFTGQPEPTRLRHLQRIAPKGLKMVFHPFVENLGLFARSFPLAVSPSLAESFGLANLETLAAGIPLLSSSTGLMPELLDEPWLFEPEVDDLLKHLKNLQRFWHTLDPDLDKIHETIRREFTPASIVPRLENYYQRLLGE